MDTNYIIIYYNICANFSNICGVYRIFHNKAQGNKISINCNV